MKKYYRVARLADDNILYDESKTILFISDFHHETEAGAEVEAAKYLEKKDVPLTIVPIYRKH